MTLSLLIMISYYPSADDKMPAWLKYLSEAEKMAKKTRRLAKLLMCQCVAAVNYLPEPKSGLTTLS